MRMAASATLPLESSNRFEAMSRVIMWCASLILPGLALLGIRLKLARRSRFSIHGHVRLQIAALSVWCWAELLWAGSLLPSSGGPGQAIGFLLELQLLWTLGWLGAALAERWHRQQVLGPEMIHPPACMEHSGALLALYLALSLVFWSVVLLWRWWCQLLFVGGDGDIASGSSTHAAETALTWPEEQEITSPDSNAGVPLVPARGILVLLSLLASFALGSLELVTSEELLHDLVSRIPALGGSLKLLFSVTPALPGVGGSAGGASGETVMTSAAPWLEVGDLIGAALPRWFVTWIRGRLLIYLLVALSVLLLIAGYLVVEVVVVPDLAADPRPVRS